MVRDSTTFRGMELAAWKAGSLQQLLPPHSFTKGKKVGLGERLGAKESTLGKKTMH